MTTVIRNYFPESYWDHLNDLVISNSNLKWSLSRETKKDLSVNFSLSKKIIEKNNSYYCDEMFDSLASILCFVETKTEHNFSNPGSILNANLRLYPQDSGGNNTLPTILSDQEHYSILYFFEETDSILTIYEQTVEDKKVKEFTIQDNIKCEANSLVIIENKYFSLSYPKNYPHTTVFSVAYQIEPEYEIFIPLEICESCITPEEE